MRLKDLVPPALLPAARALRHPWSRPGWEYVAEGWRADDVRAKGWHHESIVAAQLARWPAFVAALQGTGPLGLVHEDVTVAADDPAAHNAVMTVAYALSLALSAGHAAVLDWGGGLGYYAALARALFPDCRFDWTVKELPELCAAARPLLPEVRFDTDEDTALARRYDLVLASNALQYAQDWAALIGRFAAAARGSVLLTKLPVVSGAQSYVVVQRPHFAGYMSEYISWVFNRAELLAAARAHGLTLVREFMLERRPYPIRAAPEQCDIVGYLFARR